MAILAHPGHGAVDASACVMLDALAGPVPALNVGAPHVWDGAQGTHAKFSASATTFDLTCASTGSCTANEGARLHSSSHGYMS